MPNAVEIRCAECGCRVDRVAIVEPCATYPGCCCSQLPPREEQPG